MQLSAHNIKSSGTSGMNSGMNGKSESTPLAPYKEVIADILLKAFIDQDGSIGRHRTEKTEAAGTASVICIIWGKGGSMIYFASSDRWS